MSFYFWNMYDEIVTGTSGDDVVSEVYADASLDALIKSYSGDDIIEVLGLLDDLSIWSGSGDDEVLVSATMDDLFVDLGSGNDLAYLSGFYDDVVIFAGDGDDTIEINAVGDDLTIYSGDGNDTISISWVGDGSSWGNIVSVYAGSGDDSIWLNNSSLDVDLRIINGGSGQDMVLYFNQSESVTVDLQYQWLNSGAAQNDWLISIEDLIGSNYDDVLKGNYKNNIIRGARGDDIIEGRSGNDSLSGDFRAIRIFTEAEPGFPDVISYFEYNAGNDTIDGGYGDDSLYGDLQDELEVSSFAASGDIGYSRVEDIYITFGNDYLKDLHGENLVVGDISQLYMNSVAGSYTDFEDVSSLLWFGAINYGFDAIMTGFGNDTIYGDVIQSNMMVIAGSYSFDARVDSRILFFDFNYGNDLITDLGGDNTVVGDVGDETIILNSGAFNYAAEGYVGIGNVYWNYGNDEITTGSGNDSIYGDAINLTVSLEIVPFTDDADGNSDMQIYDSAFNFGADIIYAGAGDDVVYGDLGKYDLNLTAGDYVFSNDIDSNLTNTQIYFGSDEIYGELGNNTLIGDVGRIEIEILLGENITINGFLGVYLTNNTNVQFGHDYLDGSQSDNNYIVGDVHTWQSVINAGSGNENYSSLFPFISSSTYFSIYGDDTIIGSTLASSSNTLIGDFQTLDLELVGSDNPYYGGNNVLTHSMTMALGNDYLEVAAGSNNLLIGDGQNVIAKATSSNNVADESLQLALPYGGHDYLIASYDSEYMGVNPNDITNTLIGDFENYDIIMNGGIDSGSFGLIDGFNRTNAPNNPNGVGTPSNMFGSDQLINLWGKSELIGDVKYFNANISGATNTTFDFLDFSTMQLGGFTSGLYFFGNDYLQSASPTNDTLYGEGISMSINITGGIVANGHSAWAGVDTGAPMIFGDDVLQAGAGDDVLYGDWQSVDIFLQDGQVLDFGSALAYWEKDILYGNDTFISDSGNDTYIGDGDFNYTHLDEFGNDISFFDNAFYSLIDAMYLGAANDTIDYSADIGAVNVNLLLETATDGWGDTDILIQIENVVGSEFNDVIVGDHNSNIITAGRGDDDLTGWFGYDEFVFNQGDGNDTINDFEDYEDLINIIDYGFADVSDFAALTQVGADTVVDFNGVDSVTLIGVNVATIDNDDFIF